MKTKKELKEILKDNIAKIEELKKKVYLGEMEDEERLMLLQQIYDNCIVLIAENVMYGVGKGSTWASDLLSRVRVEIESINEKLMIQQEELSEGEKDDFIKHIDALTRL